MITGREALAFLFVFPAVAFLIVLLLARAKGKARRAFLAHFTDVVRGAGAAMIDERTIERGGRSYTIDVNISPLFSRSLSLRLAAPAPGAYEFQLKRAENIPVKPPPRLAADPFYRTFAVEGMVRPELEDFLLRPEVRAAIEKAVAAGWNGVSQFFVERILFDNRFAHFAYASADLERDLATLDVLTAAPLTRVDRGGFFTVRHGFEPRPFPWHWTVEARAKLPPNVTRSCVTAYFDSPLLNAAMVDILRRLGPARFIPTAPIPDALTRAYGGEIDPVAADHFMDGQYFGAAIERLADVPAHALHDAALGALGDVAYYARRLRDDENSWFTGEVEILSTRIDSEKIEAVVRDVAAACGGTVKILDAPFTPKLLKEDRLEMTA